MTANFFPSEVIKKHLQFKKSNKTKNVVQEKPLTAIIQLMSYLRSNSFSLIT